MSSVIEQRIDPDGTLYIRTRGGERTFNPVTIQGQFAIAPGTHAQKESAVRVWLGSQLNMPTFIDVNALIVTLEPVTGRLLDVGHGWL